MCVLHVQTLMPAADAAPLIMMKMMQTQARAQAAHKTEKVQPHVSLQVSSLHVSLSLPQLMLPVIRGRNDSCASLCFSLSSLALSSAKRVSAKQQQEMQERKKK